jgi:hypothetical protein
MLEEVAYFSSVYFVEEHNVNASMMWYNVVKNLLVVTYPFFDQGAQLLIVARDNIPHKPFVVRQPLPRWHRTCHLGVLPLPPLAIVMASPCDLCGQEASDKPTA